MPTAVLNLDLTNLPAQISVPDHYTRAYILIRYKGRPVGKIWVPVKSGQLTTAHVYPDIMNAVEPELKKAWLHDYLQWDERQFTDQTLPSATIAVCTRNRTADLERCLTGLMQLPDDGQQIMVVDNCPLNDETKQLVAKYPRVQYVLEKIPGLDVARNTALRSSTTEVVAFIDDDAVPDHNWLRALLANFNDSRRIQ